MSLSFSHPSDRRSFLGGIAAGATLLTLGRTSLAGFADDPKAIDFDSRAIDAIWKAIAEEMAQALELEAQSVLANRADAKRFPAADPSDFQQALVKFVDGMPAAKRKSALDRVVKDANETPTARKARYSRLPMIDPQGKTSVEAQYVKHLEMRKPLITKAMLDDVLDGDAAATVKMLKAPSKPQAAAGAVTKLALQLLNFKVPNTQDPIGKDEVRLTGIRSNTNGTTSKAGVLSLGDFKKGQKKTYNPPKLITTFDLTLTNHYPKCGGFCFIPFEHDVGGGYEDVVDKAVAKVKEWIAKELPKAAAQAGVALGTLIGSPQFGAILGQILGKVLGWLLGKLADLIAKWLKDDVFPVPVYLPFKAKTPAIWAEGATHGPPHNFWVSGNGGKWEWSVRWAKG